MEELKDQLAELQDLLLDAPEAKRNQLKQQVRDVKQALKQAVRSFKTDEIASECSSVVGDRLDIDKMKRELVKLGEAQMAAEGKSDRKRLKSKVKELKKSLAVAVSAYKGEKIDLASHGNTTTSDFAATEESTIEKIRTELSQLQEFLMVAPESEREQLMAQIKNAKKSLQSAVVNFKAGSSETSSVAVQPTPIKLGSRDAGALVIPVREENESLKQSLLESERAVTMLTDDLHRQKVLGFPHLNKNPFPMSLALFSRVRSYNLLSIPSACSLSLSLIPLPLPSPPLALVLLP